MGLANVGGVFVVLIGGLLIAGLISFCEFVWVTHKEMSEGNVHETGWKGMFHELRKSMFSSANVKPVKRRYGSSVPRSEAKL